MLRSRISAALLLPKLFPVLLGLAGCMESTDQSPAKNPSERTGAVGVTSQDIDDMAKPAAPAKSP